MYCGAGSPPREDLHFWVQILELSPVGKSGRAARDEASFSPRKQNLTLYLMSGFAGRDALLAKLGKHKAGRACLYVNRLYDLDAKVLEKLIRESVKQMKKRQG